MTFSDKTTTLLDEPAVYLLELRDFFVSRGVRVGSPDDLRVFLGRLDDPELQEEVGCLLRSIVFREEGEIATTGLAAILLEVVCGPGTAQSSLEPILSRRVAAFVQEAIQGVASSQPHVFAVGALAEEQSPQTELDTKPYYVFPEAEDLRLEPFREPIVPKSTAALTQKSVPGLLALLQRFYWLPAGVASVLAIALCVCLPHEPEPQPSSTTQPVDPARKPLTKSRKAPVSVAVTRPLLAMHPHPVLKPNTPRLLHGHLLAKPKLTLSAASALPGLYPPTPTFTPSGEVLLASSGLVASHLLYAPAPEYPLEARTQHTQGTVLLRLLIDHAGTVASTQILHGSAPFAAAAVQAVRRWRYTPFVTDGTAKVATLVTITFRLPL